MIPYLVGNESPSVTYLNPLFQGFDDKLSKLMAGGKSFFLAQDAAMPQKFCGKPFFFTTGAAVYANRVPGWVDSGGGITRPYNHSQFTNAVAAIDPTKVTWDEANKIAFVPVFLASAYAGLPNTIEFTTQKPVGTGLLDWSLQAHTVMHQGASDSQPVPYYIQEASIGSGLVGTSLVAEKHYRFCVAEIIMEGPTTVTLPPAFDKYCCFRIHNFNSRPATVIFSTADGKVKYTVPLQPYSCATVRRDAPDGPTANYRAGFNYFFKFEGGDPRFYWFAPKNFLPTGQASVFIGDGTAVTNSMAANNLTNPAILLDWVNYFLRDLGPGQSVNTTALEQNGFYAGWQQDPAVQADVYKFYKDFFGDPSQPATLLGDLIHHKGDIMIVRSSKTQNDPVTGKPVVILDKVTFKGYATIVADFAAKQLTVVENGAGNLVISNADTANNVYLIPYGTNLLKTRESHPTCFSLVGKSFTIENAILENPDPTSLLNTAPQLIFHPSATTGSTTKQTVSWDASILRYNIFSTVQGNPQTTLNWATSRSTVKTLNGIHKIKVSDLLTLDFWGDPTITGQNSSFVTITNRKLTLTPEGLVLTFTETDSSLFAPVDANWINLKRGVPTNKSIAFRSHGWGYFSAANGSRDTGWLTGRAARYLFDGAFQNEVVGPAGKDFDVTGGPTQTTVSVLGRLKFIAVNSNGRFWSTTCNDNLIRFMQNAASDSRTFGALFAASTEIAINSGSAPVVAGAVSPISMTLLPEMYNGLARAVNAINRASPLNWKCLRWNVFGKSVGFPTVAPYASFHVGNWDPNLNKTSSFTVQDTGSLKSGVGIPGFFYQVVTSGTNSTNLDGVSDWVNGDLATFTPAGKWVKSHPGQIVDVQFWGRFQGLFVTYGGIYPMSMFAAFDPGSQYESLCSVIGIPVKTVADLPGSPQGYSFDTLTNQIVGNGILFDQVTVIGANPSVNTSVDPVATSADMTGTLYCELLSTTKLLNGQPTGSQCVGTWDDSLMVAPGLIAGSYPDIGRYYVVPDDVTSTTFGQMKRGDLVVITGFSGNPNTTLNAVVTLKPMDALLNRRKGFTISDFDLNTFATAAGGIRWITINDVRSAVEALGFQFSFIERCIPMSLYYFESPYTANPIFGHSRSMPVSAAGTISGGPAPTPPYYIPSGAISLFSADARLGNFIKFCPTADMNALWKSVNFEAVGSNPIAKINPSSAHSPIIHAVNAGMVYDPHVQLGATFDGGAVPGNGQFIGRGVDAIGVAPNEASFYYIGYSVLAFDPTVSPELVNQLNNDLDRNFEVGAGYREGTHQAQLLVQAFNVQNSASFQAFPGQIVLVGRETWTRQTDWWTQSLFNLNYYRDFNGDSSLLPWRYIGAPASQTFTLGTGNGLTVVAPSGSDVSYTMITNIGAPIISL